MGFPSGSAVKNPSAMQELQETQVWSLDWEDPLQKGMATHSSILAWEIPWTEEPGGLQSMGSESDTTERPSVYTHTPWSHKTVMHKCMATAGFGHCRLWLAHPGSIVFSI